MLPLHLHVRDELFPPLLFAAALGTKPGTCLHCRSLWITSGCVDSCGRAVRRRNLKKMPSTVPYGVAFQSVQSCGFQARWHKQWAPALLYTQFAVMLTALLEATRPLFGTSFGAMKFPKASSFTTRCLFLFLVLLHLYHYSILAEQRTLEMQHCELSQTGNLA